MRSTKSKGGRSRIGFVADERRLNVGLTRARASLLVVGNFQALQSDANWRALVQHAKVTGYRCWPYCLLPMLSLRIPLPRREVVVCSWVCQKRVLWLEKCGKVVLL